MKKIIVTGGAGFIGSALIRYLIKRGGAKVLNVDKLTYAGNLESLKEVSDSENYSFAQVDICDKDAIAALFSEFQPDAVMHLAAESHVDRSIDGPSEFIQTNVVGTATLLECATAYWRTLQEGDALSPHVLPSSLQPLSGCNIGSVLPTKASFRFLHISTDEVYGSLGDTGLFTETTHYDPRSPYSASKAAADHMVMAWHHTYGLPVLLTNCSNNYGPYHFPEKLIPLVILNALDGKQLPIYGKGDNVRDWLYVDDHAKALTLVLEKGVSGESYNVGGNNERTNLEVVETICATLDQLRPITDEVRGGWEKKSGTCEKHPTSYKDLITFVTDRPGHDKRYAIDAIKLKTELGWKPEENFDTGIEQTIRWYLDNEWWWAPLRRFAGERLGKA